MSDLAALHGSRHALFDVSLAVRERECLALVGESGSGKTTLARCIIGLHNDHRRGPASRRRAAPLAPATAGSWRRGLQYIFQSPFAR